MKIEEFTKKQLYRAVDILKGCGCNALIKFGDELITVGDAEEFSPKKPKHRNRYPGMVEYISGCIAGMLPGDIITIPFKDYPLAPLRSAVSVRMGILYGRKKDHGGQPAFEVATDKENNRLLVVRIL